LIPEKGIDGGYNRVSVHISGKGGGRMKIPVQNGLALGSIVNGETLAKMEEYAEAQAEIEDVQEKIKAVEQRIEQLEAKIKSRKLQEEKAPSRTVAEGKESPSGTTTTTTRTTGALFIELWEKEINQMNSSISLLFQQMKESQEKKEKLSSFTNSYQGFDTPIDIKASVPDVFPIGFDSLSYSSEYIDMKQDLSEIHSRMKQASSASSMNSSISGGGWIGSSSASLAHTTSKATADRLDQIKKEGKAIGVLAINALATTRHVRCFSKVHFDRNKLRSILDVMKNGSDVDCRRHGITVRTITRDNKLETVKEIYVLTQAVLGASFTALITLSDEQTTEGTGTRESRGQGGTNTAAVEAKVKIPVVSGGVSGGYSNANQSGMQSEDNVLNNISNTRVNIEISCQGAMPIFARNVVEHETLKPVDLNPSKFPLSQEEEGNAEKMASANSKERDLAVYKRMMQGQNSSISTINLLRGIASVKNEQSLHTVASVMEAYENFATQVTTDPNCGVPIGFNYTVYSQEMLQDLLNEITPPAGTNETPPLAGDRA
jgi:hypothetical protein